MSAAPPTTARPSQSFPLAPSLRGSGGGAPVGRRRGGSARTLGGMTSLAARSLGTVTAAPVPRTALVFDVPPSDHQTTPILGEHIARCASTRHANGPGHGGRRVATHYPVLTLAPDARRCQHAGGTIAVPTYGASAAGLRGVADAERQHPPPAGRLREHRVTVAQHDGVAVLEPADPRAARRSS